jgi:hypothetical protein
MPQSIPSRNFCAPLVLLLAGLLTCAIAGCGGGGEELLSVSGTVKNGSEVLKTGSVTLHPDETKGNKTTSRPRAEVAEDGTYTLYTMGEEGAPAGWYKVTVAAEAPRPENAEGADLYAPPVYLVREDYTAVETTPLTLEVKADAPEGHYDISLEPK